MSAPPPADAQPQRTASASTASASSALPSAPTFSPMQRAPVTVLALICRYLNADSLLAASRACRALNAATSHPLTYQHEIGIRVDERRGVQPRGPSATFGVPTVLRAALSSRLMHHMRLLTLRPIKKRCCDALLRELHLLPANHPLQLHALTVSFKLAQPDTRQRVGDDACDCARIVQLPLSLDQQDALAQQPLYDLSLLPCTRFLKALILACTRQTLSGILQYSLPPSLEFLQLTIHLADDESVGESSLLPSVLPDVLSAARLPLLRQLVVAVALRDETAFTSLEGFRIFERVSAAATQLDSIHWLPMIELQDIESSAQRMRTCRRPLPRVRKLHELRCMDVAGLYDAYDITEGDDKQLVNAAGTTLLSVFPDLRSLSFASFCHRRLPTSVTAEPAPWPPALSAQLQELRISSITDEPTTLSLLAAAKLVALQTLEIVGISTPLECDLLFPPSDALANMLASMPQLTQLSIHLVRVENLTCFRHAPKLLSLRGLTFPYTAHECDPAQEVSTFVKQLHPDCDLSDCFPVLQSLHVSRAVCTDSDARHLLQSISTLRDVSWCSAVPNMDTAISSRFVEILHQTRLRHRVQTAAAAVQVDDMHQLTQAFGDVSVSSSSSSVSESFMPSTASSSAAAPPPPAASLASTPFIWQPAGSETGADVAPEQTPTFSVGSASASSASLARKRTARKR